MRSAEKKFWEENLGYDDTAPFDLPEFALISTVIGSLIYLIFSFLAARKADAKNRSDEMIRVIEEYQEILRTNIVEVEMKAEIYSLLVDFLKSLDPKLGKETAFTNAVATQLNSFSANDLQKIKNSLLLVEPDVINYLSAVLLAGLPNTLDNTDPGTSSQCDTLNALAETNSVSEIELSRFQNEKNDFSLVSFLRYSLIQASLYEHRPKINKTAKELLRILAFGKNTLLVTYCTFQALKDTYINVLSVDTASIKLEHQLILEIFDATKNFDEDERKTIIDNFPTPRKIEKAPITTSLSKKNPARPAIRRFLRRCHNSHISFWLEKRQGEPFTSDTAGTSSKITSKLINRSS